MKSIVSYPNRGPWGDNRYRGNCSGHVIKDLVNHFKPANFVDVCMGSGTSKDVCEEMNVPYVGLDLRYGNDYTKHSVLKQLPWEGGGELVFSHPAYHNMVVYSGNMYEGVNDNDASRCLSVDHFLEHTHVMLMNQREATKSGGHYVSLIGDMRSQGKFFSFQADMINMMPKDELVSVTIKAQHNTMSGGRRYGGTFIPILHEYILVWSKKSKSMFLVSYDKAVELRKRIAANWRVAIRMAMIELGGKAALSDIYEQVEAVACNLIAKNKHWKAKIRQLLQVHYTNVERGVWAV